MKTRGALQQQSNQALRLSNASTTKKRRKRGGFERVDRSKYKKKFECVPLNWEILSRQREGGNSIGKLDFFFKDPVTENLFRSKKKVKEYLQNNILDETETSGGAVIDTDDDDDIAGVEAAMEVVVAEDNIGIVHEHVHEENNDANPNVGGNHMHPPPLGIMQDLNELPPEAEWWEDNVPAYPPVAVDGNLD